MTLLAEPLFVGTLDASEHDITITACNNAGFGAALYGRGGIHNLYSVCGTHARHGCRHRVFIFAKKPR